MGPQKPQIVWGSKKEQLIALSTQLAIRLAIVNDLGSTGHVTSVVSSRGFDVRRWGRRAVLRVDMAGAAEIEPFRRPRQFLKRGPAEGRIDPGTPIAQ
jgi:hypothetical protein